MCSNLLGLASVTIKMAWGGDEETCSRFTFRDVFVIQKLANLADIFSKMSMHRVWNFGSSDNNINAVAIYGTALFELLIN